MFRLASPDTTYKRRVRVPTPTPEGGVEEQYYTAHYRLLGAERAAELAGAGDAALVRATLVGWSEISDHDGTPLEFNPPTLERLVGLVYWCRATSIAYIDFSVGAPEKNSEAPPATS